MEQTISDVVKVNCFNCKDKGEVIVSTHSTGNRPKIIPCPVCSYKKCKGIDPFLHGKDKFK